MRRALLAFVVITAACGGKPVSFIALAPQPAQTSYDCALRKVNELQYTVTNENREAGFIQADHHACRTRDEAIYRRRVPRPADHLSIG